MGLIRFVVCAAIGAALASPVSADVTVRSRVVEQGNGGRTSEVTEYRKGLKMRTDSSSPGITNASIILDAGTGRMVMLWHDSKTATEHDFYEPPRGPAPPANSSAAPPSLTRTSRTREIAGSTCTVYQFRATIPLGGFEMSEPASALIEGSTCLVTDGPGQADFLRIQRAIADHRPNADPLLTISLETAALGVAFASEMTISIGGNAPTDEKRQIGHHTREVTSISTEPIPDSVFGIPPGYTVAKR